MNATHFHYLVIAWIVLAILLVPVQLKITAPYGRHTNKSWGPELPYRLGWIIMELVSPLTFGAFFLLGENEKTTPLWLMFALWMVHYFNRSLVYPLRARMGGKRVPLAIVGSAIFFNLVNGFLNGHWLGSLSAPYPAEWFNTPQFTIGIALFLAGAFINIQSEHILMKLRKPGETGYKIPQGGLFRYLSCPNLFGEIVEWTGFAILCWNLPAASFAVWTAANLVPRALSHHRWYHEKFPAYPAGRKAVFPFLL